MRLTRAWIVIVLLAASSTVLTNCTKLNLGGSGILPPPQSASPSPSPSTSPTGSPVPCGAQDPSSSANNVIVGMSTSITVATAPGIGLVGGYAVADATGTFPNVGGVISQWVDGSGDTVPITSQDTLQFANLDSTPINHSAVFLSNSAFPNPHVFPSPDATPTGSAIAPKMNWSTGIVPPFAETQQNPCFSQVFTLSAGTYYFGDIDYYESSNMRDILIVGTPSPALKDRRGLRSRIPTIRHSPARSAHDRILR
jgi:hypothetical protein